MAASKNLDLGIMAEGFREMGFTVEKEQVDGMPGVEALQASIETGRGEMRVYTVYGGIRIGKPNGSGKYYWGTEKQCLAVVRQTLKCYQ